MWFEWKQSKGKKRCGIKRPFILTIARLFVCAVLNLVFFVRLIGLTISEEQYRFYASDSPFRCFSYKTNAYAEIVLFKALEEFAADIFLSRVKANRHENETTTWGISQLLINKWEDLSSRSRLYRRVSFLWAPKFFIDFERRAWTPSDWSSAIRSIHTHENGKHTWLESLYIYCCFSTVGCHMLVTHCLYTNSTFI